MPVAHGERVFGRWEYIRYFMDHSVQIIQPDIGNAGGLTETKKICDMAYTFDVGACRFTPALPICSHRLPYSWKPASPTLSFTSSICAA